MENTIGLILALFLFNCLFLAASSRMLHLIRLTAMQGLLLGVLPLVMDMGVLRFENCILGIINISIKGFLLPFLLYVAMKKAAIQRELEPIIGYSVSTVIILIFCGISFWVANHLSHPTYPDSPFASTNIATAFTLLLTGLFLISARKKALTQVVGFLTFENGISLFGLGLATHHHFLVELGILLDVFALVFIMGIAICQIKREFSHIDANKLTTLDDLPEKESSAQSHIQEVSK